MKIGMNLLLWTAQVQEKHLPLFDQLKRQGFDGVEIPLHPDYSGTFLTTITNRLDSLELSCTCSAFLPAEGSLIHPDKAIREKGLDQLQRFLDMAAQLGSSIVMGPIHSPHKQFPGRGPSLEEKQWCAEILYQAGEYAFQYNIQLSVEFLNRFECYFLTNSMDAHALVELTDHPMLGMTYDTHHAHLEDSGVYDTIMTCAHSINHIHLSESHRGSLGTGTVHWNEVFRAIRDMQYDDWLVIEAFGMANPDIIMGANIWRNCFESETGLCQNALRFVNDQRKFTS